MAQIMKALKNLLKYQVPKNPGGFELLERDWEGISRNIDSGKEDSSDTAGSQTSATPQETGDSKEKDSFKKPRDVENWNRKKHTDREAPSKTAQGNVDADLSINLERLGRELHMPENRDIKVRRFSIGGTMKAFIIFLDGMTDKATINDFILKPLMELDKDALKLQDENCILDYINYNVITVNEADRTDNLNFAIEELLNGLTLLFIEGCTSCMTIESKGFEKRGVEKPSTETVVRGPMEAFTENLRTNITLLRRIIRNRNLVTEIVTVGKTNKSMVAVMYMKGIANPELINEVLRRIRKLDKDFVMGDGMVGQLIMDNPYMLLPQLLTTERPDRTASFLMEGKVAIVSDGTPFADIAPATFWHLIHTSEDSFINWQFGTLLRMVRIFGLIAASFLPGLYVALITFHQEMIPTELLASIARSRENVPFPSVIEVLTMELSFELIREGGIRVPGVIGQTLGIIGAVILGQAAVAAGIVSPILIIIVAVTGLGSFAIPNYTLSLAVRTIRFGFIILGAIMGFYGISLGIFILGALSCSMKSFGVPFFTPVAPRTAKNPDLIVRAPIQLQKERPDFLNTMDRKRSGRNMRRWRK